MASPPDEVELKRVDARRLQVLLRRGGRVIQDQTFDIEDTPGLNGVTLERSRVQSNANVAALVAERTTARLIKGRDGRLYGHFKTAATGVAFMLPMSAVVETWGRWDPVDR